MTPSAVIKYLFIYNIYVVHWHPETGQANITECTWPRQLATFDKLFIRCHKPFSVHFHHCRFCPCPRVTGPLLTACWHQLRRVVDNVDNAALLMMLTTALALIFILICLYCSINKYYLVPGFQIAPVSQQQSPGSSTHLLAGPVNIAGNCPVKFSII